MNVTLSWDLFVIVFFIIIIAYSFIIGRNATLKVIISTYISILAADGIGNVVERYISPNVVSLLLPGLDFLTAAVVIKIMIFVACIVVLSMRGEFSVQLHEERYYTSTLIINGIFGVLSAGLVVSTILYYMSGGSFLQVSSTLTNEAILSIKRESQLVRLLIDHYNVWFSLPAIAFAFASFFKKGGE